MGVGDWAGDAWDAVGDWADGDVGVLDVALPFYGATRLAAKGVKAGANAVGGGMGGSSDGGGGGGSYTSGNMPYYQYGGDPNRPNDVVNAAVDQAGRTGGAGMDIAQASINRGDQMYGYGLGNAAQREGDAVRFDGRGIQQGNFYAQNRSLASLGGLEATQGPSAAQAQLQQGTNQALSSQLALARSGRGFGGNAAAMGLAQGNAAGIQANQANAAAQLRAQEDAAWRQRQAGNLTNMAGMQGQQSQANLGAAVQGRSQNDAMVQSMLGLGQNAYQYGGDMGMRGYGMGMEGIDRSLAGQALTNNIRTQEMQGNTAYEEAKLRAWAAQQGYDLAQQQASDQKDAATISAVSSGVATYGGGGRGGR